MANRKRKEPQVILYKSWLATFIALNRDLNGQILEAISRHVVLGEDIEVDRAIRPLVESMLSDIDTNMTLYSDKCDTNKRTADKREQDKRDTNVAQTCNKRDTNVSPEAHVISTSISTSTNTSISTNTSKEISPNGDTKKRAFSLRDVDGIIDEYLIIRDRDDIRKVIKEFFAAKKQAKKTISETAVRRNINKALDLADNNPDQVKELFELALERGWQGIYEDNSQSGIAKATRQKIEGIDWMALYGQEDAQ